MAKPRVKYWFWAWTVVSTVHKDRKKDPNASCEVWQNLIIIQASDEREALRKSASQARIVRPSGFIIAGRRSELSSEEMAEDFRVLNDSLKNVDVICFDDLLDNLTALHQRLTDDKGQEQS